MIKEAKLKQKTESYGATIRRRFKKHKPGLISLYVLIFITLLVLLAPVISPYPPDKTVAAFNQPPSFSHLLGTDQIGRDLFSRLLYGTGVSLLVGIISTLLTTFVGALLGLVSGYFGGWIDVLIMRFTDMVMSFPYLLLVLVAAAIFSPGLWNIVLILGFVNWPGIARLVRGNVLSLREKTFVQSSIIAGMPGKYILFSDILPNTAAPVLVYSTSVMAFAMLDEAALSFLGQGVQPPAASLGNLLGGAESLTVLTSYPWRWIPPGVMILVLVVAINFIGDALRDAFDPKSI